MGDNQVVDQGRREILPEKGRRRETTEGDGLSIAGHPSVSAMRCHLPLQEGNEVIFARLMPSAILTKSG